MNVLSESEKHVMDYCLRNEADVVGKMLDFLNEDPDRVARIDPGGYGQLFYYWFYRIRFSQDEQNSELARAIQWLDEREEVLKNSSAAVALTDENVSVEWFLAIEVNIFDLFVEAVQSLAEDDQAWDADNEKHNDLLHDDLFWSGVWPIIVVKVIPTFLDLFIELDDEGYYERENQFSIQVNTQFNQSIM